MFKLNHDSSSNILLIEINENILSKELLESLVHKVHKAIDSIDKNKNLNRLFDARELKVIDINMNTLKYFSEITKRYNKNYKNIKIAIVASTDLMFGEFRAHEVYGELPEIERRIFRSLEEAYTWLKQS